MKPCAVIVGCVLTTVCLQSWSFSASQNQFFLSTGATAPQSVQAGSSGQYNPAMTVVDRGSFGLQSIQSAYLDQATGKAGAYAWQNQPIAAPFSINSNSPVTGITSAFAAVSTFTSTSASAGPTPVTFRWTFEGSFTKLGTPGVDLGAGLGVQIRPALSPADWHESDTSAISFAQPPNTFDLSDLQIQRTSTQIIDGGAEKPFAGAQQSYLATDQNHFSGVVTLTTTIAPGQIVGISADIGASVSAGLNDAQSAFIPSAGSVDAYHTAQLQIFLPAGYGFDSSNAPLLANVITAVPEVAPWQAFAIALPVILCVRRKRMLCRAGRLKRPGNRGCPLL